MVPVPDQVSLSDAEKHSIEGREAIVEAMLYLAPQCDRRRRPVSNCHEARQEESRGRRTAAERFCRSIEPAARNWTGPGAAPRPQDELLAGTAQGAHRALQNEGRRPG